MNSKFTTVLLGVAALILTATGMARAEDQLDPETKARVDRFEKGPATIDVSNTRMASRTTTKPSARNAPSATS